MRRHTSLRGRLAALLALLLAVLCWRLGVAAYAGLGQLPPTVTFGDVEPLVAADYDRMVRTEALAASPRAFALWSQWENAQLAVPGTGRTGRAAVLLLRGDSRLVLPVSGRLEPGDTAGCLLDRRTAEMLFGNSEVEGRSVVYNDREYVVRGVLEAPAGLMVLQAGADDTVAFTSVTAEDMGADGAFLMRHSLDPAYTSRTESFVRLAGLLSRLPLAAALLIVLAALRRAQTAARPFPAKYVLASAALLALGTAAALGLLVALPPDYIPSRWSDFSFWGTLWDSWRVGLGAYLAAPKHGPDRLLLRWVLPSLLGLCAAYLELCVYGWLRRT